MKWYVQKISLNFINFFGIIVIFLFAMIFTFLLIYEEYRDFEKDSITFRKTYIQEQKAQSKRETQSVVAYLQYLYESMQPQTDTKQLQSVAINTLDHLSDRKNGKNYIFIYTLDGENVSDPHNPQMRDQWIMNLQDRDRQDILHGLLQEAKSGGGFIQYRWKNPADGKFSQKISYVQEFVPWGWLIGTGVYLSDVDALIAQNRQQLKERLIKSMMEILTLSAILFWFAFAGIKLMNTIIRNEIATFREFFKKSVTHTIVIDKKEIHIKEFQVLVGYVNEMVSAIHDKNRKLEELNASLEEKVLQKTAKLQEQISYNQSLVRAQDSFIKHSIHEINTPLAVILTHIDIYKMKYGENSYLSKIEAATKMLSNIYDDLGYMIKKDRMDYRKEAIDLSFFMHERIDFFSEVAQVNGHMIHAKIEEGLAIRFNRVELERIVDNNISNAIKYANKSTDIFITLKEDVGNIQLEFLTNSKKIEDIKQIFEPFHQEEHLQGGFGLGLEIVGMICKKEDVGITVDSSELETRFSYRFNKGEEV